MYLFSYVDGNHFENVFDESSDEIDDELIVENEDF